MNRPVRPQFPVLGIFQFLYGAPNVVAFGGLVLVVILGTYLAWQRWGGGIRKQPQFQLAEANVRIPDQPAWVSGNVKDDVFRDAALEKVNLLDADALVKVVQAFKAHTWVASVVRAGKSAPGKVYVDLVYRRPVGFVVVRYQDDSTPQSSAGTPNNAAEDAPPASPSAAKPQQDPDTQVQQALQPVDQESYVLPADYFHQHPDQLSAYPRIVVDYRMPAGPEGTPWGDVRVAGAARIAGLLVDQWKELGLYQIVAAPSPLRLGDRPAVQYQLFTRDGRTQIVWGNAPGAEMSDEAKAAVKARNLITFAKNYGALDSPKSPEIVDLRSPEELTVAPRTASRPQRAQ